MKISAYFTASLLFGAGLHGYVQQPKTAGEEFKNIQVLKRVPADQWFDTMAFIAGSLGVTCDHCHSAKFETDEGNPAKLKAREMMRMVDSINAGHFGGQNVVTCNSCHRGTLKPQGSPVPNAEHWMKAAQSGSALPAAIEILGRYKASIGMIKTQSISVRIERFGGTGPATTASADVLLDGDKARISHREGGGERAMLRNGESAWIDEGKGWRAMSKGETFDAFEIAEVLAPDQVGGVELSGVVFEDKINGLRSYVVPVSTKDGRKWLFFDADSGVLLRQRSFFSSFYGDASVDINYGEYKVFGKAHLPTRIEVVNAGGPGLIVRQVISRRVNIALPSSEFQPSGN